MVGYYVGLLKCVAVFSDRSKIGGEKVSGTVWPGGSIDGASDGNIEGVVPWEGYPLGISLGT